MLAFTTLSATTPLWLICVYLFVFGAGLGLIMQVIVLVVQNAVDPSMVGTATSTNNYFREVGASLGVAIFGAMFTNRLSEKLTEVFTGAGANAAEAGSATATLDPQTMAQLPDAVREGIVNAYADSLAPVFWYLIPFILIAFVLALFLKQVPLSDTAGMVARGEAIGGAEAEALEAEARTGGSAESVNAGSVEVESDVPGRTPTGKRETTPASLTAGSTPSVLQPPPFRVAARQGGAFGHSAMKWPSARGSRAHSIARACFGGRSGSASSPNQPTSRFSSSFTRASPPR